MLPNELISLETLTQIDDLMRQTTAWAERPTVWRTGKRAQGLVQRVLPRVETLRIRLEAPLVVATFGGTGTGKSSLVNALVGSDSSESGRQRPTTMRPKVIAHPSTDLEALSLPIGSLEVIRRESDLLQDIILIDCPDPDTTEGMSAESNLSRLRSLLPYCDALIYTSTQQKYRSARVLEELGEGAKGCRLFFVQTHADIDSDIRDDWRAQLAPRYHVPDIFFVDSRKALQEQLEGKQPTGEFGRLIESLKSGLRASQRIGIRRANVLDLLQASFSRGIEQLDAGMPAVKALESTLVDQRREMVRRMAGDLKGQLLTSRNLWERRLLSEVTDNWGFTPFSGLLRIYSGLGGLIASFSFYRARSSVQMAVIGLVQGARWLKTKGEELSASANVEKVATFSLSDNLLRESEIIIEGYVREAEMDGETSSATSVERLRRQASTVEQQFLGDASRKIDEIIRNLAARNSRPTIRLLFEALFASYVIFVLGRVAKSFFYDSFWLDRALLKTEFYIPAVLFFVIWSVILIMLFTRRLRRGLESEVQQLVGELVEARLSQGLFPQWDQACREAIQHRDELNRLLIRTTQLRNEFGTTSLGGEKPRA